MLCILEIMLLSIILIAYKKIKNTDLKKSMIVVACRSYMIHILRYPCSFL